MPLGASSNQSDIIMFGQEGSSEALLDTHHRGADTAQERAVQACEQISVNQLVEATPRS